MSRYASQTQVSSDRSRAEIERTLQRYGAVAFSYGWADEANAAFVTFVMGGKHVRFVLPMPDRNDREYTHTPTQGNERAPEAALTAWEQACRQRWRALALVVKAKLEAVASEIVTFEEEFLAHIVLPNGRTVGRWLLPQVESVYETGQMPSLLPWIVDEPPLLEGEVIEMPERSAR